MAEKAATGWSLELKEQVVEEYLAGKPTPETTGDIVTGLAEKHNKSANGIVRILVLAQVYITRTKQKTETSGTSRIPKAESLLTLTNLMDANEIELDSAVIDKLTGKAAIYWAGVLKTALETNK